MNCWYCHEETNFGQHLALHRCNKCDVSYLTLLESGSVIIVYIYGKDSYLRLVPNNNKCALYKKNGTSTYSLVYSLDHIPKIDASNVTTIVERLFGLVAFS